MESFGIQIIYIKNPIKGNGINDNGPKETSKNQWEASKH